MAILQTVTRKEAFLMQINGDYNMIFDTINVTVAGALASGAVLKDAATAAVAADTVVLGILAEDKPAGAARVKVMVRGNPTLVDGTKLSVASASVTAALDAKGIVLAK